MALSFALDDGTQPLSNREKGALIGGVTGAPGAGALVGAAAGAVGGALAGDQKDKREREEY